MKKLPKFVIHLNRLNSDISNVSFLLQKYEEDRKRARMEITGKSIPIQRRYLSDFSGKLFDEIARVATEEGADQFGNEFEGMQNYQYAEMTVDPSYQVFSIRLLGDVDKPLDKQKRYTIFCADNIFDPTTINIISNLRGISDGEAKDVINKNEDPNSKGKPTIKNVPGRGKLGKKSCKDEELEELPVEEVISQPTPPAPPGQEQNACFDEPSQDVQPTQSTPTEPVGDPPPSLADEPEQTVWAEKELEADELTLAKQASKYNVTAKEIAQENGIDWTNEAINAWVASVGGKKLSSGWVVFQVGNKIRLPKQDTTEKAEKSTQPVAPAVTANVRSTWTEFVKTYFFPEPRISPSNKPFTAEDSARVSEKYDAKPIKTKAELEKENAEIKNNTTRLQISAGTKRGFQITNAGSSIFESTEQFKTNLQGLTGDPIAVLGSCYEEIFNKYDLGLLIKNALQCLVPAITCRELLSGLSVSSLEDKIDLAFATRPRIRELAKSRIAILKESVPPGVTITADMMLEEIQDCVDFEALCSLDFDFDTSSSGFEIPTVSLPQLPITDLYATVGVEIENAILESLIQSIKSLIMGVLEDLSSCSTLDALVVGALQGQLPPEAQGVAAAVNAATGALGSAVEVTRKLRNLFETAGEAVDATGAAVTGVSKVALALGRDWENFVNEAREAIEKGCESKNRSAERALNDIQNIQALVGELGGVEGLADLLADDNADREQGLKTIDAMLSAQFDFKELLNDITADEDEKLSKALAEVGKYSISPSKEKFTLQRIEGDQIKTIAETTSVVACPAKITAGADINGPSITSNNLVDTLGNALDDIASVLTPGEFLQALAGLPSNQAIKIIQEIIKDRYPEFECGDPVSLIAVMGEISGLNTLKDELIVLSDKSTPPDVARKFCPEDDVRLELRRQLLGRGNLTPEQKDDEIKRIVKENVNRYNNLRDLLSKGPDVSPEEVFDNLRCGTGLNPNGLRPMVVEDQINASINMMFDKTKFVFDEEVKKLTDAVSSYEQSERELPRTIASQTGQLATSIFQSSGLGGGTQEPDANESINPEFLKMLLSGYLPEDVKNSNPLEFADSLLLQPAGPFTNGEPVKLPAIKKKIGGLFMDGFNISDKNINVSTNNGLSISIKGSMPILDPANQYLGDSISAATKGDPKWSFRYSEDGEQYTLKINSVGSVPSRLYGKVPFFENYKFTGNQDTDPEILNMVQELNKNRGQEPTRKGTFSYLLGQKTKMALLDQGRLPELEVKFEIWYSQLIKDWLRVSTKNFKNNRLLQKVPAAEFDIPIFEEAQTEQENIILGLVNFSPQQTAQQRRCGIDPHLLDLKSVKDTTKEQFEKECDENTEQSDGTAPVRRPLNSAGFVGAVLTFIRLYAIEYVFRSIFVLDEFEYERGIAEDPLMVDYVSSRIKEDLTRLGIWGRFEEELDIAFGKLDEQGKIEPTEYVTGDDGSTTVSDTQGLSEGEATVHASGGLPKTLKMLTKKALVSVYERFSKLVGQRDGDSSQSYELAFLKSLMVKDIKELKPVIVPPGLEEIESEEEAQRIDAATRRAAVTVATGNVAAGVEGTGTVQAEVSQTQAARNQTRAEQESTRLLVTTKFGFIEEDPFIIESYIRFDNKDGITVVEDLEGFLNDVEQRNSYPNNCYYGVRLSYLTNKNIDNIDVPLINQTVSERERAYVRYKIQNTDGETKKDQAYTNIPIACEEISFDPRDFIGDSDSPNIRLHRINQEANLEVDLIAEQQPKLIEKLSENMDVKVFLNYCTPFSRLSSLMSIYSTYVLNGDDMKFLLEGTKQELIRLFDILEKAGDYSIDPSLTAAETLNKYKKDFDQTGNPAGPSNPSAFYLYSITGLRIYKALTELIDPNIFIAAKIQAAAAFGLLSPKLERAGGDIKVGKFDANGVFLRYVMQSELGGEEEDLTINVGDEQIASAAIYKYDDLGNLVIPDYLVVVEQTEEASIPRLDPNATIEASISDLDTTPASLPGPIIRHTPVYQIDWGASLIASLEKTLGNFELDQEKQQKVNDAVDVINEKLDDATKPTDEPDNATEPTDLIEEIIDIINNINIGQTIDLTEIVLQTIPETDDDGVARSDAGQKVIRRGIGFVGPQVPGGDTNAIAGGLANVLQGALDVAGQATEFATGGLLDSSLTDIDINLDLLPSLPVYPGEPVNIPLALISMLLRPANILALRGEFAFAGPPITQFGLYLLALDPLISQLPYFQLKFSQSGVGEAIKRKTGVDLSAGSNFVCSDLDNNES